MIIIYILLCLILLLLIAIFTSSEIALIASRIDKITVIKSKKKKLAISLINNIENNIASLLVGTNIAVVTLSTLSESIFSSEESIYITIFVTFIILIIGEIIPKGISNRNSSKSLLFLSDFIKFISVLFKPIVIVVNYLSNLILKIFRINSDKVKVFTASDIENALLEISANNLLPKYASELSGGIKYLENLKVVSVIRPRHEVSYSLVSDGLEGLLKTFKRTGHNKILFCDETLDNVIGIVYLKDIVRNLNVVISRKPVFVYEHASFNTILDFFKKDIELDLVVVVDEYGQVVGVVTKTDVINTISGFLYTEKLYIIENINSSQEIIFKGEAKIEVVLSTMFKDKEDEINKSLLAGINIHDTLSNYILSKSKNIPDENEKFILCNLTLEIVDRSSKKIEKVKVYKKI